jgi:hypothetical protein
LERPTGVADGAFGFPHISRENRLAAPAALLGSAHSRLGIGVDLELDR